MADPFTFGPRAAWLATTLLCATLPVAGCICERGQRRPEQAPRPRELAFFDFVSAPDVPHVQLWPPDDKAPKRKKRDLLTKQSGQVLVARVDGKDPYFVWDFETATRAAALSVELDSDTTGRIQLFWANDDCKIYQERCSTIAELESGSRTVDFVLDPGRPLNGVRLDLPETSGAELQIHRVRLFERPRLSSGYAPREEHTEAVTTAQGLRLSSKTADPWMTFDTPWLEAEQVEAIEVELLGPTGAAPELFWSGGDCANFESRCRTTLTPVAGTAALHAARVAGTAAWRGKVAHLRFDPGEPPGDYLLKSLVLVRRNEQRD